MAGPDWSERFVQQRDQLLGALGAMTDGGIVERLEHIGATSVPGLFRSSCLDIALAVWPFPLEQPVRQALASIGYELDPAVAGAPEQRFRQVSGAIQLYVVEAGSPLWMDYLVLREHLRHDMAAREAFSARKREWVNGVSPSRYRAAKGRWLDDLLVDARRSWIVREGFAPVQRAAEELHDFPAAWHIGGGWALDLFLGRVTRIHDDVDVAVARADQATLHQHLTARGWTLLTPFEQRLQPWPAHMRLELPRHQVHAHRSGAFIDFLLGDIENGVWRYRRDPTIIRTVDRMGLRSDAGMQYLAPEVALLFKSSRDNGTTRAKDQADFEETYQLLEAERQAWLRWALTATNPAHPWLERL
jgi:GrpB-like predicted nucleotidyltransferase (UPF0157 family)